MTPRMIISAGFEAGEFEITRVMFVEEEPKDIYSSDTIYYKEI